MKVPLEWDREFLGFGKRSDHCVEEDILKQGMGDYGVCVKNLNVSHVICTKKLMDSVLNCT